MNTYNDSMYKRISKKDAEKRYNAGQTIYLLPCKLNPHNIWFQPLYANKESCDNATWEHIVNDAAGYNCNAAQGYYLSYYLKIDEPLYQEVE